MFSPHKNLAISTVAVAPSPALSGTSLEVAAGTGSRFSTGSPTKFYATVWAAGELPDPTNAEIVLVERTDDVFTITRAQGGSSARTILVGDFICQTIAAEDLEAIEAATVPAMMVAFPATSADPGSPGNWSYDPATFEFAWCVATDTWLFFQGYTK